MTDAEQRWVDRRVELDNVTEDEALAMLNALKQRLIRVYHCNCPEDDWVQLVREQTAGRVEAA